MNKLINSPRNLGKTEPLAYIEATRRAGHEGIPPHNVYAGKEWAKISIERIRKYLARYANARAELQVA